MPSVSFYELGGGKNPEKLCYSYRVASAIIARRTIFNELKKMDATDNYDFFNLLRQIMYKKLSDLVNFMQMLVSRFEYAP